MIMMVPTIARNTSAIRYIDAILGLMVNAIISATIILKGALTAMRRII